MLQNIPGAEQAAILSTWRRRRERCGAARSESSEIRPDGRIVGRRTRSKVQRWHLGTLDRLRDQSDARQNFVSRCHTQYRRDQRRLSLSMMISSFKIFARPVVALQRGRRG